MAATVAMAATHPAQVLRAAMLVVAAMVATHPAQVLRAVMLVVVTMVATHPALVLRAAAAVMAAMAVQLSVPAQLEAMAGMAVTASAGTAVGSLSLLFPVQRVLVTSSANAQGCKTCLPDWTAPSSSLDMPLSLLCSRWQRHRRQC